MKHRYISNCSAIFDLEYYTKHYSDEFIESLNEVGFDLECCLSADDIRLNNEEFFEELKKLEEIDFTPDNYHWEFIDRDGLIKFKGSHVAELLSDEITFFPFMRDKLNFIKSIEYVDTIYSPDDDYKTHIVMDVEYDPEELNEYCFDLHKKEFCEFLLNGYNSNKEFNNILPKSLLEFKKWDNEQRINTMLEFIFVPFTLTHRETTDPYSEDIYNEDFCVVHKITGKKYAVEVRKSSERVKFILNIDREISDNFSPYE